MRNEHDAEDVVQDATLRALRYFRTFTGGDGRAWFLRIVRNTCAGWSGHRHEALTDRFDEEKHRSTRPAFDPETLLLQIDDATLVARALRQLPDAFHQLLVLRELEGLSYRELADVIGIPIGTVMSRLSRARDALRVALDSELTPSHTAMRTQKIETQDCQAPIRDDIGMKNGETTKFSQIDLLEEPVCT
jgi:RNA polymerase sigma-70 factor (ECF subfamily)